MVRLVVLLLLGTALGLPCASPAAAEDEPAAPPAGTTFIEDLDAALSQAHRANKPVIVWFSQKEPDENDARILEHYFQTPDSAAVSKKAVAVRVRVGAPVDKKIATAMRRYGIRRLPAFALLGPGGEYFTGSVGRTTAEMLENLDRAQDVITAWPALEATWKKAKDAETQRKLAGAYIARCEWDKARTMLRKVLALESRLEEEGLLLNVLRHTGPDSSRAKLLRALLEAHPDHEHWVRWRIELAMIGVADPLPTSDAEFRASLPRQKEVLLALVGELPDAARQVAVHSAIARAHKELGEREGIIAQCDIIRAKLEALPTRPDLRRVLAEILMAAESYEAAKTELRRIVAEHPTSDQAPESLLEVARICYVQARAKTDLLDAMPEVGQALEALEALETRYPESEANRTAQEQAMPAIKQLIREQLDASRPGPLPEPEPGAGK